MPTACFTGHRKLAGAYYNRHNPSTEWHTLKNYLNQVVKSLIHDHQITHFISGLAIGVDMLGVESVALVRAFGGPEVEITGAMPFPSQASRWPKPTRDHWDNICGLCNEVLAISEDPYHPSKMQIRNVWMVDNSDYVIAIWDGISKGGTQNCMDYAKSKGKPILLIQPMGAGWKHSWII